MQAKEGHAWREREMERDWGRNAEEVSRGRREARRVSGQGRVAGAGSEAGERG